MLVVVGRNQKSRRRSLAPTLEASAHDQITNAINSAERRLSGFLGLLLLLLNWRSSVAGENATLAHFSDLTAINLKCYYPGSRIQFRFIGASAFFDLTIGFDGLSTA